MSYQAMSDSPSNHFHVDFTFFVLEQTVSIAELYVN